MLYRDGSLDQYLGLDNISQPRVIILESYTDSIPPQTDSLIKLDLSGIESHAVMNSILVDSVAEFEIMASSKSTTVFGNDTYIEVVKIAGSKKKKVLKLKRKKQEK